MDMCCEKTMMLGWRNAWSIKLGSRPMGRPKRTWKEVVREDCEARKLNKEDAMDRCKWRKVIKEVRWPGWVWAGEWYRPTRVVPDKRPLNGCCCCCFYVCEWVRDSIAAAYDSVSYISMDVFFCYTIPEYFGHFNHLGISCVKFFVTKMPGLLVR